MVGKRSSVLVAVALMMGANVLPAHAAPGDFDTTFSGDGRTTTGFGTVQQSAEAVAVRPDGRILAVGVRDNPETYTPWFAIAQYTPSGALDTTFGGGDGKVVTAFGESVARATDVALLSSGKFVVVGSVASAFAVARYNADGTLDTTFHPAGQDGVRTIPYQGTTDLAEAVAMSGSKIVIAGTSTSSGVRRVMVARLTASGALDSTFGAPKAGGGRTGITRSLVTENATARDVAVVDGAVITAGEATVDGYGRFLLLKHTPTGVRDTDFGGGDGWVATRFSTAADAHSTGAEGIALMTDGRLVVAGETNHGLGTSADFAVARYLSNGAPDGSFSGDGKATFDYGADEAANDVALMSDGRIVLAGYRDTFPNDLQDQAVMRVTADGRRDATFGNNGLKRINVNSAYEDESANDVTVSGGKIVVVGEGWDYSGDPTRSIFTVTRLLAS